MMNILLRFTFQYGATKTKFGPVTRISGDKFTFQYGATKTMK